MSSRNRLVSGGERHRGRSKTTSSSRTRQNQNRGPTRLPEYEPPSCPLDADSRAALALLSTSRDGQKYEDNLRQSITLLTNSVRDINDKYVKRKETLRLIREKRGPDGDKTDRERAEETALLMLSAEVPPLTDECDRAVRGVIDLKIELADGRAALEDTVRKVELEAVEAAHRQEVRDAAAANNDDDDDDEEMAESPSDVKGPLRILRDAKTGAAADYASRTLYERYGLSNDYVGFKGMWHDAVHGADGVPLQDASKWFTQQGGGGGGGRGRNRADNSNNDDDDDEDLVVAEEHLSIHCPLSMVVMQDPYTSAKCKHTFEKAAIVEFLRSQPEETAQCPQTGCDKEVSVKDFYADQVMLRKIQRAQASGIEPDFEDDDDDDDDDDEVTGLSMEVTQQRKVKSGRDRDRGRQLVEDMENSFGD